MKKLCLILLFSSGVSAWAGDPPAAARAPLQIAKLAPAAQTPAPHPAAQTTEAHPAPQPDPKLAAQIQAQARRTTLRIEQPAPNETTHGRVKVDGIFVEAVKSDNPLQLINPAAPDGYGSVEDNVVRDPASGKISGLKFLEFRF
jgi:hypothetical protein